MDARVSILMPTYEPRVEHLLAAVESVMKQTFRHWTLLIHDDASRVDVRAMIAPYLHDRRVTFIRSERRLGIGGNWNACLKQATAPFIQYLFQDDLWEPLYLERALEAMERDPSIALVSVLHHYLFEDDLAGIHPVYDEVIRERQLIPSGRHIGREFAIAWAERGLRPNVVGEPSFVLMRSAFVRKTGRFSKRMAQGLDMEYWLRMLCRGNIAFVKQELGSFRVHAGAASARNEQEGIGIADRLHCFGKLTEKLPAGPERRRAKVLLRETLIGMIAKYRHRKREGKRTDGLEKLPLMLFALRHPVIVSQGLLASAQGKRR